MKCPHCLVSFHDNWLEWQYQRGDEWKGLYQDGMGLFGFKTTLCPACNRIICAINVIRIPHRGKPLKSVRIVYPKAAARPVPPEVEAVFANDFKEACLVIGDSEKASAALSRRCLQKLLIEKAGVKEKANLYTQIEEVLNSGTLPSHLTKVLHGVRVLGNFAVHSIKSTNTGEVIEVEAGEAEWLLDILEQLFDFYFVRPAISERTIAAVNKKLEKVGKPKLNDTKPV